VKIKWVVSFISCTVICVKPSAASACGECIRCRAPGHAVGARHDSKVRHLVEVVD